LSGELEVEDSDRKNTDSDRVVSAWWKIRLEKDLFPV
jgi:hypothetical protein